MWQQGCWQHFVGHDSQQVVGQEGSQVVGQDGWQETGPHGLPQDGWHGWHCSQTVTGLESETFSHAWPVDVWQSVSLPQNLGQLLAAWHTLPAEP